jgi:hypothetical protein
MRVFNLVGGIYMSDARPFKFAGRLEAPPQTRTHTLQAFDGLLPLKKVAAFRNGLSAEVNWQLAFEAADLCESIALVMLRTEQPAAVGLRDG